MTEKISRRQKKLEALLAKNHVPGNGVVTSSAKDSKKVKLRAAIYPVGGGQPYEEDVQVGDDGTFTIKDSALTYHVSKGSVVRCLDGMMRTTVREDMASTINFASLSGENILHPMVLNGIAKNNYWQQWGDFLNRKAFWRQAGTWGIIGIGLGILGALIWNIKTTGNGFEHLKDALEGLRSAGAGSGGTVDSSGATHAPIAPGGN